MKSRSIRGRMTVLFAASVALLMLLSSSGLSIYSGVIEERDARRLLAIGARKVRQELQEEGGRGRLAAFVAQEREDLQGDGLSVWLTDNPASASRHSGSDGIWRFTLIPAKGQYLVIGFPWGRVEHRLWNQSLALAALAICVTAVSAVLAWHVVGQTLQPIGSLSREADEAPVQGLSVKLRVPSSDAEIVGLVATLNRLLLRQADAAELQRRFYAAASHELRTPLHAISGFLELGLSRDRSKEEYRSALEEAFRQTSRLTKLVQDLLFLTRLDSASPPPPLEQVGLRAVCETVLRQLEPLTRQRSLLVRRAFETEGDIEAPAVYAEVVVRNLLENAARYTRPGGAVDVTLLSSALGLHLRIENDLPEQEVGRAQRLVEPFYRPDASRQSETGGSGLGLAICDGLARANHWRLSLEEESGRFRVEVLFPRGAETAARATTAGEAHAAAH